MLWDENAYFQASRAPTVRGNQALYIGMPTAAGMAWPRGEPSDCGI